MSSVILHPARLAGTLRVPPSKSAAHRAILCAALAPGRSELSPIAPSKDILVTIRAVQALGVHAELTGETLTVERMQGAPAQAAVDCGESGSSLRFLIPICAALGVQAAFTGHGRLPQRPIGLYTELLPAHGVACESAGGLPLGIRGTLRGGEFRVPGNISSQYITGLLLALPLLPESSAITLTSPLESAAYVDMTLETMRAFGVTAEQTPTGWNIPGGQQYKARRLSIEGDWSQAAFFLAAGALGGDLRLEGLNPHSTQGDRAAAALFDQFGAYVSWEENSLIARPGSLQAIEIDASQIPDLVPILAAAAAFAPGVTRIKNAARLRLKESDRLTAMAQGLGRLGVSVSEQPDGLTITGAPAVRAGKALGCNDHRIVMALSIAALRANGPIEVTDAESIQKSYPSFFQDYNTLGGNAHVLNLGNESEAVLIR